MWSEKYRPTRIEAMVGNEEARLKLLQWYDNWKFGGKAALLIGPPGTGKTTLVNLLAAERGLNLVELNASDTRTKDALEKRIGEVMSAASLFGERSLIFLDEVDGLAGRSDQGALESIKEAVKTTRNPVVMAANDPDSEKVRKLSDASVVIRFKPPPPREVEMYLRMIVRKEKAKINEERLMEIVSNANGDLRQAINAVQSSGSTGRKDTDLTVAQAVNSFLDAPDTDSAVRALRAYPEQPRDKVRDLFSSVLRSRLPPARRADALEILSRADVLMGEIVKGRDWRLLRYLDSILARELRPAVSGEGLQYTQDGTPWNLLLRIWNDSKKIRELGAAYSSRVHNSRRGVVVQDLPYLFALCATKKFRLMLVKSLDLDEPLEKFLEKEAGRIERRG